MKRIKQELLDKIFLSIQDGLRTTSGCVHNVKKFDNTGEDLEDLISIDTIGLIKAIESFQPNKGTKLATFAARCIENEILMHLRSLKKTRRDVSLHDPMRTQREIAKELGISRSYVSRIEKRALMKLYHEFYKAKR